MDDGARRWMIKTARKNYWRVAGWYDFDDLLQEGFACYYRVRARYPDAQDPPHIMRLFQVTFINHITDLANKRMRTPETLLGDIVPDGYTDEFILTRLLPRDTGLVTMTALLDRAPPPVAGVFQLLMSEEGRRKLRAQYRVRPGGVRETLNDRLCRLLGLDPTAFDVPALVRSYLSG